jgi:hypothetical protein
MAGSMQIPKSTKTAPNCAGTVIFFPAAPFIPEGRIFKLPSRVDRMRCHGVCAVSDPIIDYHRPIEIGVAGGTSCSAQVLEAGRLGTGR